MKESYRAGRPANLGLRDISEDGLVSLNPKRTQALISLRLTKKEE
jgi:hypothetical protein